MARWTMDTWLYYELTYEPIDSGELIIEKVGLTFQ